MHDNCRAACKLCAEEQHESDGGAPSDSHEQTHGRKAREARFVAADGAGEGAALLLDHDPSDSAAIAKMRKAKERREFATMTKMREEAKQEHGQQRQQRPDGTLPAEGGSPPAEGGAGAVGYRAVPTIQALIKRCHKQHDWALAEVAACIKAAGQSVQYERAGSNGTAAAPTLHVAKPDGGVAAVKLADGGDKGPAVAPVNTEGGGGSSGGFFVVGRWRALAAWVALLLCCLACIPRALGSRRRRGGKAH
jgi:hypothetical protein